MAGVTSLGVVPLLRSQSRYCAEYHKTRSSARTQIRGSDILQVTKRLVSALVPSMYSRGEFGGCQPLVGKIPYLYPRKEFSVW